MAVDAVWHENFVQGFNSCSWFAEISLRRKKKEHYRQFNDELRGECGGHGLPLFLILFLMVLVVFGNRVHVDIELPRLGGWVIVFRSYPLHEMLLRVNMW